MRIMRWVLAGSIVLALGCESAPIKGMREGVSNLFRGHTGEPALAVGIKHYEDGNYGEASRLLLSSLEEGISSADQVRAHKYLAFMHCVSGREARCREEFRTTLSIDPTFELAANEAGHPIWGPVFRSVKAGR